MKSKKGVTLIALAVMIGVLGILASIATYSGMSVVQSSKFTKFSTELKIMQTQVNNIYEKTKTGELEKDKIGQNLSVNTSVSQQAARVFTSNESEITSSEGYKYWNLETIKNLGIEGVEQDFFVNLDTRSIVSYKGFEYEGKTYYTLAQIPNGLYNVNYTEPNAKPTFGVDYTALGENKWRINVTNISYQGYIDKWQVQYKLEEKDYWNTSDDLSFVVNSTGNYIVKLINGSIVSEEKNINIGYIQDGLQLHLDAINNIGEGDSNHSITTTVWKDLSGNDNDAKLNNFFDNENSKWNNNNLELDGTNDFATIDHSKNTTMTTTNQTIEIVMNRKGHLSTKELRGILFVRWVGYTVELNAITNNQYTLAYGRNSSGGYLVSNQKLELNIPYSISLTHSNNISKIYINTKYDNQQSVVPSAYTATITTIGKYTDNNPVRGQIYSIRMYNRELTPEEINYNYQIDKGRFGI